MTDAFLVDMIKETGSIGERSRNMERTPTTVGEFCRYLAGRSGKELPADHKVGARLVCPEYSPSVREVKNHPLPQEERIFALCWHMDSDSVIHASLCPSPEAFHYRRPFVSGEKTQLHTHSYIELAYVAEGEFRQRILGKEIVFSRGDLCLIDKNCLHQDYLLNTSSTVLFLGIANDMFTEVMDENVATRKIIAFLQSALMEAKDVQQFLHFRPGAGNTGELERCLFRLLQELYENRIGSHYICKGLLLRIFRLLSSEYEFSLSRDQQRTMNWLMFEEVTEYIQRNYAHITIQDLVREFHFQEDYFNRLIRSRTDMTYSAYLQQIRLDHAGQQLLGTGKTVDEIMEAAGYHNKGYFYRIFREKYGMTPAEYRKKERKSS